MIDFYDVESVDHVLRWPSLKWLPVFGRLLVLHASDLASWGVFWAMTGAVLVAAPSRDQFTRSLSAALAVNLLVSTAAVDSGPEQVRVFAENGTLINRLLMQWWPLAAMLVLISLTRAAGPAKQNHRKQHGGGGE